MTLLGEKTWSFLSNSLAHFPCCVWAWLCGGINPWLWGIRAKSGNHPGLSGNPGACKRHLFVSSPSCSLLFCFLLIARSLMWLIISAPSKYTHTFTSAQVDFCKDSWLKWTVESLGLHSTVWMCHYKVVEEHLYSSLNFFYYLLSLLSYSGRDPRSHLGCE